jgi:hypothetical protein
LRPSRSDALRAQEMPHLVFVHVARLGRDQQPSLPCEPDRRRIFQYRQNAPVSPPYLGAGPGRGRSAKPTKPYRANRPRHVLTVRGIVPTARAIDSVERVPDYLTTLERSNLS